MNPEKNIFHQKQIAANGILFDRKIQKKKNDAQIGNKFISLV